MSNKNIKRVIYLIFELSLYGTYILLGCFVFNLFVPPTNPFSPPIVLFLIFFPFTKKHKNSIDIVPFHAESLHNAQRHKK